VYVICLIGKQTECSECGHQVPHCTSNDNAPSYPSVTTFSGAFLWWQYHIQHGCATKKIPEEVVTDGYEGAIYVQCGQR